MHRSGTVFDIRTAKKMAAKAASSRAWFMRGGSQRFERVKAPDSYRGNRRLPGAWLVVTRPKATARAVEGAVSPASGALSLWLGVISTPMKTRAERNRVVPKGCKLWLALNPVASISTLDPYRQISPASLSRAALAEPLAPPCGCGCGSGFSDEDGLCDFPPFER